MQDYYHYAYTCPYFSWVTKDKLVCERGCSVIFSDKAEAKRYLRAYCCKDYMACTIAKMLNEYWEGKNEDL